MFCCLFYRFVKFGDRFLPATLTHTRESRPATFRHTLHTGMTFLFRIAFTWWLGNFISRYLKVHFMLRKYTLDSKSQTLRMHYPFQSTGRPISHRNVWSFRVYKIPLRDFVPEWNSRPGTTTWVNSRRGDSRRHDILWWYHVNKCRATGGNGSDVAPSRRSPRCHVNTRLIFVLLRWFHMNGTPKRTNFPPIESFSRAVCELS